MKRFFLPILLFLLFAGITNAQTRADSSGRPVGDSLLQPDAVIQQDQQPVVKALDSVSKKPSENAPWTMSPEISFSSPQFSWEVLKHHPYFDFKEPPATIPGAELHRANGKELLFYVLVLLLVWFALLRRAFPKYFADLFRLFFRTTLKQRQLRDQLMQTPLPSLLLNVFFFASGGLYASFLLQHYGLNPLQSFWLLSLYCCLGLAACYIVKFIGLKVLGWLFNMTEAADSYIFIVFVVNKMIGILLLPFLVILAFSIGNVYTIGLTLSWCLLAGLLAYRLILTYGAVRNLVKVNPFHFFLYLCAFEIAPLLLVYKGLLLFFRITA